MSEKEYNQCVDKYCGMLFKYFVKNISDAESSHDLTQDTFYSLWIKHREVEISKAKAFLFITAHNRMVNHINYTKKQNKLKLYINKTEPAFEENRFENTDLINRLVETLSPAGKEALVLRDVQGFSYKDISQIMQISEQNVKVIVFRARTALKKLLDGGKL
ncbi:MAG: RNA polymerase sigma factor [Bacteroidales bacterium]|nr:RNA polymerase sigma factor [Bacteroidales bacterium]